MSYDGMFVLVRLFVSMIDLCFFFVLMFRALTSCRISKALMGLR